MRFIIATAVFLIFSAGVGASPAQTDGVPALSPEARISVLTMLQGDPLYSAFGHTAVRVRDEQLGLDEVYNYGTFDFETPYFYLKFMRGQLDYLLAVDPFGPVYASYYRQGRPMIEQVLDVDAQTRQEIFAFLEWNALPENRAYRYHFFFDNCSTRPRDVVEAILGEHVIFDESIALGRSYRQLIRTYLADRSFTRFGMDLLLGMPADRVAEARDEVFLPLRLFEALEHAQIEDGGTLRPLVSRTDTLYWFDGADEISASLPWPQIVFWMLFAAALLWTGAAFRSRSRLHQRTLAPDAALFALIGLAGLLMLLMWFGTEHTVTVTNLNMLWAWPLHLVAAGLLVFRPQTPLMPFYFIAACFGTAVVLLGWPFWPQEMHPAVVPILLLVVLRSGWLAFYLSRQPRPALKT